MDALDDSVLLAVRLATATTPGSVAVGMDWMSSRASCLAVASIIMDGRQVNKQKQQKKERLRSPS